MTKKQLIFAQEKVKDYCNEVIGKPEKENDLRLQIDNRKKQDEEYKNFITWLTDNYNL